MSRRGVLGGIAGIGAGIGSANAKDQTFEPPRSEIDDYETWQLSEDDWRARLNEMEFRVLRKEATERAGTSPLDREKRKGTFVCAGCRWPLFSSETKFDSGTGWPSFYDHLPNAIGTKADNILFYTRTEYHCARCGGHQGHVFDDGPQPTGQRWCNNGVALDFVPDDGEA